MMHKMGPTTAEYNKARWTTDGVRAIFNQFEPDIFLVLVHKFKKGGELGVKNGELINCANY